MKHTGPSRAVVDLDAYRHNLALARRFAGQPVDLIAVIKADAYGHGAVPVAGAALRAGARMLGVATVGEGAELRAAGVDAPVLVMVTPRAEELPLAVRHRLTLMISDTGTAARLGDLAREAGVVLKVHCKIDTGMGRQGFSVEEAPAALQMVARVANLDIEGVATHFAVSELPDDPFTQGQIKLFRQVLREADRLGVPYEFAHAANSGALLNHIDSLFDAIRPGLLTYGVWPGGETRNRHLLQPVLRWETEVVQVRALPAGASIGYGRTRILGAPARTAVLPVGYADGYRHSLSNNADVLIRGRRCPVVGSVCMDQIVVDVTSLPEVREGDTAVLIGADGGEEITVSELALRAGTIPYDILTGIGRRVAREHRGGGGVEEEE